MQPVSRRARTCRASTPVRMCWTNTVLMSRTSTEICWLFWLFTLASTFWVTTAYGVALRRFNGVSTVETCVAASPRGQSWKTSWCRSVEFYLRVFRKMNFIPFIILLSNHMLTTIIFFIFSFCAKAAFKVLI